MHQSSLGIISDNHFIISKGPTRIIPTPGILSGEFVTTEHSLFGIQKFKMPFKDHNECYH